MADREDQFARLDPRAVAQRQRPQAIGFDRQQRQVALRVVGQHARRQAAPVGQEHGGGGALHHVGVRDDQTLRTPHRAGAGAAAAVGDAHQAVARLATRPAMSALSSCKMLAMSAPGRARRW